MNRATKTDWKNLPLTALAKKISCSFIFSEPELNQINQGFIPEEMEDKWFIYSQDNIVYFQRSWTVE